VCVVRAAVPSGVWATSSWAFGFIRSTVGLGDLLFEEVLQNFGSIGAIVRGGSTVLVVRAAVPVSFWATASRAFSFIGSTVGLDDLLFEEVLQDFGSVGAIVGGSSTILVVRAAVPVSFWAAASRAFSFIWATVGLGDLFLEEVLQDFGTVGAVIRGSSTVLVVRTAIPSGVWATSRWAFSFIRSTVGFDDLLLQQVLQDFRAIWAVVGSGSTVLVVRAAVPVGFWATASRTFSFIGATVCLGNFLFQKVLQAFGTIWAIIGGSSTVCVVRAAVPSRVWTTSSWAFSFVGSTTSLSDFFLEKVLQDHWAIWAVIGGSGTVLVVGTAIPVGLWATSSWAFSFIWATVGLGHPQTKAG